MSDKSKSSSLRLVLIIPFLTQILATVGLVGYLSFINSQKAVENLANQLMGEVSSHIEDNLKTQLDTAHKINRLNADLIEIGVLSTDNQILLGQHFLRQIKQFPDILYIYFGNPQGGIVVAQQDKIIGEPTLAITQDFVKNDYLIYNIDESGKPTTLKENAGAFDSTSRPWFIAATETGEAVWSDIYLDVVTDNLSPRLLYLSTISKTMF